MATATQASSASNCAYLNSFLPDVLCFWAEGPPLHCINEFLDDGKPRPSFEEVWKAYRDNTYIPFCGKLRMSLFHACLIPAHEIFKVAIKDAIEHRQNLDLLVIEKTLPKIFQVMGVKEQKDNPSWLSVIFFETLTTSKHFPLALPKLSIENCSPAIQKTVLMAAIKLDITPNLQRFLESNPSCHAYLDNARLLSEVPSDQLYPLLRAATNRVKLLNLLLFKASPPRLGYILRAAALQDDTATVKTIVNHPRYSEIPPMYSSEAESLAPTESLKKTISAARSRRRQHN